MTSIPQAMATTTERTSGLARATLLQKLGGYVNTQLAEFAVTARYPLKRLGFTLVEAKIQTEKGAV